MATNPTPAVNVPAFRESRDGERTRTLYAVGKLIYDGRQTVCTVRNISDGGVGIQVEQPPEVGTSVTISLRGIQPTQAIIRWVDGSNAGLAFVDGAAADKAARGLTPRSPRFSLARAVQLFVDDRCFYVDSIDIALGGLKLATTINVPVGAPATVVINGDHGALHGRVCWRARDELSIRFGTPLATARLATILSPVRQD